MSDKNQNIAVGILLAVVIVLGGFKVLGSPELKSEAQKCQQQNAVTPVGSRVAIGGGYWGGIEGTVIGQTNNVYCDQVVRLEYRGKWHTINVNPDNVTRVQL